MSAAATTLQRTLRFYEATIGKKAIVAVTGSILVLYVIGHMIGNLQIYLGREALNGYAHKLHDMGALLWVVRGVLLLVVVVHIVLSVQLWAANRAARPERYVKHGWVKASLASRTMIVSGPMLAAFVDLPRPAPYRRQVPQGFQPPTRRLSQRHRGFSRPADLDRIHRGDGLSWVPSLPRNLEHVPVGGLESPALHAGNPESRLYPGPRFIRRQYLNSDFHTCGLYSRIAGAFMRHNARIPSGSIEGMWDRSRFEMKLVNPANKRKYSVIVVGTGLAGASAAATLAELGYNVKCFCFQDSPRRAHSIAAQGGINAAKNYQNDGDSVYRLFYDTVKGGDFRARESNVYRLAQISLNIIDQCVAQGVPFAREYGGHARQPLVWRRAGVAHVLCARPDRAAVAARRVPGAGAPDRTRARCRCFRARRCWT